MKNKIYIITVAFGLFFCIKGISQAATVNSTFNLIINCDEKCQNDGLTLFRYKGNITETVHKTINFVTESNNNTAQNFNLNLNDSVSLVSTPTTGDWFVSGGEYDSPPSDGVLYEVLRARVDHNTATDIFQIGTSIPQDDNNFVIKSDNSSIVSCEDGVCKAVGEGTARVTVSFPSKTQASETYSGTCITKRQIGPITLKIPSDCDKVYQINGSNQGYGKILFKAKDISQKKGIHESAPVLMTYSFPSITYTITVPNTDNKSPVVACNGINNITTSGATINWSYTDPDNDPQTNYSIETATDAAFDDVVDVTNAPDNTDVSGTRSVNISGLDPNTTYYTRIQSYNDTNDWSDYATCGTSFKTLDGPVDGVCGESQNTCEEGNATQLGSNQWVCKGKNGGVDSSTCTYSPSTSLCTPSDATPTVGDEIIYTVDSEGGVSYRWLDNLGQVLPGSTNSNTYSFTYMNPGVYSRKVEVTKSDGTKEVTYCSAVRVNSNCGPQPNDEADDCSIDGSMRPYECVNGVWKLGAPTPCVSTPELIDDTVSSGGFRFNPSLVPVGGFCKLFVNVKNARICKLKNQSNQDIPLSNEAPLPYFKVTGIDRAVGVYKLYCKATSSPSAPFIQLGPTRNCYSSPNVKEN